VLFALFHRTRGQTDGQTAGQTAGRTALLEWRIGAFFAGAVLGLAGIFLEISWLVIAALFALLGGFALRALPVRDSGSQEREPPIHE
jgi:hypothetical protein